MENVSMKRIKRKRLEAAGWQIGSAAEFVGLNNEEAAYVELRVHLKQKEPKPSPKIDKKK